MALTPRNRLRSESGVIGVGTVIGLAIAALFVYLLFAAFDADTAHYGSVPVPSGRTAVELPDGETDVYYAEGITGKESTVPILPPEDLSYPITDENGQGVRVDSRGGDPEEVDAGTARVIGAVYAEGEGTYIVEADSAELQGRVAPAITFGQSPVRAIRDRFESVVEELKGPTGVVALAVLGILFLLPRVQRALRD